MPCKYYGFLIKKNTFYFCVDVFRMWTQGWVRFWATSPVWRDLLPSGMKSGNCFMRSVFYPFMKGHHHLNPVSKKISFCRCRMSLLVSLLAATWFNLQPPSVAFYWPGVASKIQGSILVKIQNWYVSNFKSVGLFLWVSVLDHLNFICATWILFGRLNLSVTGQDEPPAFKT